MRKCLLLTVLLIFATASAAWAELKIGIVDIGLIIQKSDPGQKAMTQLQSQFKEMSGDMDKKRDDIKRIAEDLQKQSMVLSQEAKQDKELEYKRKLRDYQDTQQNYQRKFNTEQQKLLKPIYETLFQVIQDYGKKSGYSAIIDGRAGGIVYSDQSVDLTQPIISELNKAWPNRPAPSAPEKGAKDSKKK